MDQATTTNTAEAPRWHLGRSVRELEESGHVFTRLSGAIREDAVDKEEGMLKGVCFSTGARGLRYDAYSDKFYEEELAVTPEAVNLERFTAGVVPVLDTHQQHDLNCVLGAAVRGWVEGGECLSDIRLTDRPDAAGRVGDIKAGIIRATSVGYTVQKWEFIPPEKRTDGGKLLLARAVSWTPHEFSFVPVPFDANSSARSLSGASHHEGAFVDGSSCAPLDAVCARKIQELQTRAIPAQVPPPAAQAVPTRQEEPTMTPENATGAATAAAQSIAPKQTRSLQEIAQITALGVQHGRAADIASWVSDEAMTLDKVRAIILDEIATNSEAGQSNQRNASGARIERVGDEGEHIRSGIGGAIQAMIQPGVKVDENAKRFMGMSLREMGMSLLPDSERRAMGGLNRNQQVQRMLAYRSAGLHTTSDFGSLLADAADKRLARAYSAAPVTYQRWASRAPDMRDFKNRNIVHLSAAPELLQVGEHGEIQYGSMSDAGLNYKMVSYGRLIGLSLEALVNDDLDAFSKISAAFGASAARLENALAYAQLTGTPSMADGVALFHADHTNLGTAALSFEALVDAYVKMGTKTGMQGESLNLTPRKLIVPFAKAVLANQLASSAFNPTTQSAINQFASNGSTPLEVIVDGTLDKNSTTAWYLSAAGEDVDTVEYAYLEGAQGPQVTSKDGWEVDGLEIKVKHYFVARATEWRGLYKSTGAS